MADTSETCFVAPSLYRRLAALLYESIVLFGVVWLAALVYGLAIGQRSGMMDRHGLQAVVFVALGLYFMGFWSGPGQTVAMRAWRLRVVDAHGQHLSLGRSGLRFVWGWLWVLPPLALAWRTGLDHTAGLGLLLAWMVMWALASYLRADHQFWHDALAGTRLVEIQR
jgi:uncharacterized RDD family membrane protein YckC